MADSAKFQVALISVLIIMIQVCDLSAEEMKEAPGFSDNVNNVNSVEEEGPLILNLDKEQFAEFVKAPSVRIVYFSTITFSGLKNFLLELESAAKLMSPFGVKVGKVDCRINRVPNYCNLPEVHNSVYAFKNGGELLELLLVNMFDVNSIMSNILQLVLLKEVPILQTKAERLQFEEQQKGKLDIVFSFQSSIGTYEHRILMEIAHGYHGEFAFAITTEDEVIQDLPDYKKNEDVALWLGHCASVTKETPCQYVKYYDAMDVAHMASFLRLVNIQLLHDVGSNKVRNPLADFDIHIAVLYYDKASKEMVANVGKDVNAAFPGTLGVITVDLDNVDGSRFGYAKELTSVPGIALFLKNEQHPHHMETGLSSDTAIRFVRTELEAYGKKKNQKSSAIPVNYEARELEAVEKQDDAVAEAVFQLRSTPINRDHLPALTDKTFPQETGSRDFLMVVFYLTFDARSMAFMRSYSDAAELLAKDGIETLAAVDCYDWTDVCGKQNITVYPTIRVFRKGQGFLDYDGPLETKAVIKAVKLLLSPTPLHLQSDSEVSEFIAGNNPTGIGEVTPVSILGIFPSKHKEEFEAFNGASIKLHGKYLMGYAAEDLTEKLLKSYNMKGPGIVVFDREDSYKPHKVYEGDMTSEAIEHAVLRVLPELTTLTFPTYFAKGLPLVILFAKGNGNEKENEIMKTMSELSLENSVPVVYCWMKVDETDPLSVGRHVLKEYNSAAVAPALAIVDHAAAGIFNYPTSDFEKEKVFQWVESALDGTINPSKILPDKEWKPLNPGYDFLTMIDKDNADKQQHERDRLRKYSKETDMDALPNKDSMDHADMEDDSSFVYEDGSMLPRHTEL